MIRSIIPSSDRSETSIGLKNRSRGVKVLAALSLSLAVYGMIGWVYVAICGLVAPYSLRLPLTHLLPHLREDTSGVISFIVSFTGFVIYRIIRDNLYQFGLPSFAVIPGCLYGIGRRAPAWSVNVCFCPNRSRGGGELRRGWCGRA